MVVYPQRRGEDPARERLDQVLEAAFRAGDGETPERIENMEQLRQNPDSLRGRRILFVVPLGRFGVNEGYYELLSWLRETREQQPLAGSVAGMVVDADSELFTKALARELSVAANQAGCAFVGRPLVEGTASLDNYIIQAANMGTDKIGAYRESARILAEQLRSFSWQGKEHPHLLALHASNHRTSNTMAIWEEVRERLSGIEIREINLRNGTLEDCSGCPYQMCLHFGERGQCFYGGAIAEDVYPAVRWADAILLLCPNYNDALSANLTAFINRLTALFRTIRFYDKAMFAIIVSGYSGSDLIAGQLTTALNMNKTFFLPGNFCMMETGNSPGSAMASEGIMERIEKFSSTIRNTMMGPAKN